VAGDTFSFVAIPLLVLSATGSVTQMGLLTGASGVAALVAGFFAGALADRVDRRLLLIGCDTVRALLYALIPLAWLVGPQMWLVYAVMPLGAAAGMVFQVTYVTVVPGLVEPDRITEANGRLNASYAAASVGGPVLAGLVSQAFGPTAAIGIDAVTFGLSALGLSLIRVRRVVPDAPEALWRGFLSGARFLWRHPTLRSLTVLLTLMLFLTTGLDDVLVFYLKHDLGQPDRTVGYVLAAVGVGSIAGALLVAPARRRLGFGACFLGGYVLCGLAIAMVGATAAVPVIAALVAVFGATTALAGTCSMSLRQEVTPSHLLGRVTSAFWTIHYGLAPLGAATLTAATGRFGVPAVAAVAGAGCVVVALCGLATPVRLARPAAA